MVIIFFYIFCFSEETGEDGALKKGGNARNKTGNLILPPTRNKRCIRFFCSQKYQILGKGIVFCMLIGKMKLKKISQIWRAPKK